MSEATTTHDAHAPTPAPERRVPVKRWIVLALILVGIWAAFIAPGQGLGVLKPVSPAIVLPGEPTGLAIGGFQITNTLLGTLAADILVLLVAFIAWRFTASGQLIPSGFYGFIEFIIEFLWNTTESTAGKWAKRVFPIMATIFLLVWVANLFEVVPGFDSIGRLEAAEDKGYPAVQIAPGVYGLNAAAPEGTVSQSEACDKCVVVPFLRVPATDLNFTFALAIIAVVMIQVFGFWSLGASYLQKFFNTKTLFSVPMFGVIDFGVGLLELVSEIAKILSFGFRLFGNIFAGGLLILILGALTAVVVPTGLFLLEVFVGAIQAYVFAMLTLVFISQATVGHGGGEEHH